LAFDRLKNPVICRPTGRPRLSRRR